MQKFPILSFMKIRSAVVTHRSFPHPQIFLEAAGRGRADP
jgi:hypothetical protein